MIATPLALIFFPLPEWELVPVLFGMFLIHFTYKYLLASAYARGAFTVVYPVVRGIGPLATVIMAYFVFAETLELGQWGGIALLSASIMGLALVNLRGVTLGRDVLLGALGFAVLTGIMVAVYTIYDAWGIRLAENAFTFLIWFFVTEGVIFPIISYRRWRNDGEPACARPAVVARFHRILVRLCQFRIGHAGHPPRQRGRGGGAARDIRHLCGDLRLVVPEGKSRPHSRRPDGADRPWRRAGRVRLTLRFDAPPMALINQHVRSGP